MRISKEWKLGLKNGSIAFGIAFFLVLILGSSLEMHYFSLEEFIVMALVSLIYNLFVLPATAVATVLVRKKKIWIRLLSFLTTPLIIAIPGYYILYGALTTDSQAGYGMAGPMLFLAAYFQIVLSLCIGLIIPAILFWAYRKNSPKSL